MQKTDGITSKKHMAKFQPTPPMLVNEISRLFLARMRESDLSGVMSQDSARLIMRELARKEGVNQLYLTKATHLKPPTVSVTLKRMEEQGLVYRKQDPMDTRAVRVYLTENGREHNRSVLARLRALDTELMQGFDEEERALLRKLLERMRDNILPAEAKKHTEENETEE